MAIHDGLDNIKAIETPISRARKLSGVFVPSLALSTSFSAYQIQSEKEQKCVISYVQTLWNFSYMMLLRHHELKADITNILNTPEFSNYRHLLLKESDWALTEQLLPVMQKFAAATEMLCQKSVTTISSYYPLVFRILQYVRVEELHNGIIGEIKTRIQHGLKDRLFVANFG